MEGLELLDALIAKHEELVGIADAQIMNDTIWTGNPGNPYRGWPKEKAKSEKALKVLYAIRKGLIQDRPKIRDLYKPHRPGLSAPRLCWSNYRCMLFLNNETSLITPIFWTPELGINNSHYALWQYAMMKYCDENNYGILNPNYRWGGFYTYGLGNGNQEQLTLYGESSDYPHNEYSEKVKECFLAGKQFIPEEWDKQIKERLPF